MLAHQARVVERQQQIANQSKPNPRRPVFNADQFQQQNQQFAPEQPRKQPQQPAAPCPAPLKPVSELTREDIALHGFSRDEDQDGQIDPLPAHLQPAQVQQQAAFQQPQQFQQQAFQPQQFQQPRQQQFRQPSQQQFFQQQQQQPSAAFQTGF